jgi:uncharacterized protein (TIGR03000 family)
MIRVTLSHLALPVIATAVLLAAAGPALAQRGGGHAGGGFRAGGYHGGYGYHSYYGYRGYHPYYRGYQVYPSYGSWYSYYDSDYSDDSSSSYYTPSTSGTVNNSSPPSAQVASASTANALSANVSTNQGTGTGSSSVRVSAASSATAGGAARITVLLPDEAELWFDSTMRPAIGQVREFTTPPLAAGQTYTYSLRARWLDGNTFRDQTQTVTFARGDNVTVNFRNPPWSRTRTDPFAPWYKYDTAGPSESPR